MVAISISVEESVIQVVEGFPQSVEITTNIPSTIFYTLDGTEPTINSTIYTSKIYLPTNYLKVVLRIFATNGVESASITETYETNILNNLRLPRSETDVSSTTENKDQYPFGTNPNQPQGNYLNQGNSNLTVNDPSLTQIPNGYDGAGNQNSFTNNEFNVENYSIKYSNTNYQNIPNEEFDSGKVVVQRRSPPPTYTNQFTKSFDPRAFVIYQDFTKEDPDTPPEINKQIYSANIDDKLKYGGYYNSGGDVKPSTGTFIRSSYDPVNKIMTNYFYDSASNKWIISKSNYEPTGSYDGNLASIKYSRAIDKRVFEWIPFSRRYLF